MITDSFTREKAIIEPPDIYGAGGSFFEVCICVFSPMILGELLERYPHRMVAEIGCVRGNTPVFAVETEGKTIGAFLINIGSALAGTDIIDVNHQTGANRFIVFGSAGAINSEAIAGRYVIPTAAYRDEGLSYHYAPPADYIELPDNVFTAEVFRELGVPFVMGRTWTTDAFFRETPTQMRKRAEEGCLTVEMEMAGLQAVCSFHGFRLYSFLQAGDVLSETEYDLSGLHSANHDIQKLDIALEIAKRL